jgi:hypothetical protein
MIETLIQNRLKVDPALADGRVYGGVAPDPVLRPYITHFHMGGELGVTFCGPDGSDPGAVQIDCWAETRGAATALAWQVYHRLKTPGPDFAIDSIRRLPSAYEPDTKLHRVSWEVAVTTETPTT